MTKTSLLALLMMIFISSYTSANIPAFIGTYGVATSNPSKIKLIINSDSTFFYQDFSNPTNKISVNGSWIIKGKKLFLKNSNSNNNFHHVWSFEDNGQIAKSRKGLAFYRLCKIK